jgi:hypothetical protein
MLHLVILCLTFSYFLMGGVFASLAAIMAVQKNEGGFLVPLVFFAWPFVYWPIAMIFMAALEAAGLMTWLTYLSLKAL